MKNKIFLTLASILTAASMLAQDFEYQGVKYTVLDEAAKTVTTTAGSPSKMTAGNNGFEGELIIPEKVEYNGQQYTVTQIGIMSFYNTTNKEKYPEANSNITKLVLPETVTFIGHSAFSGNANLKSFVFPNSVTGKLESSIFEECTGLEVVVLHEGINRVDNAFYNSKNIKTVVCYAQEPPYSTPNAFGSNTIIEDLNTLKTATLYVPAGTEDAYYNYKFSATSSYYGIWHYFGAIKSVDEWGGLDSEEPEQPEEPAVNAPMHVMINSGESADLSSYFADVEVAAWASSDADIAAVADGVVTGHEYGNAVVTARKADGSAWADIKVMVCPMLTVAYPEGVLTSHLVPYGSPIDIDLTPLGGWSFCTASIDGRDISAQVDIDGHLFSHTTMTQDKLVNIATAKTDNPAWANDIRIIVNNRNVIIKGAHPKDNVYITDYRDQKFVYDWDEKEIPFSEGGVFNVKITHDGEDAFFRMVIE